MSRSWQKWAAGVACIAGQLALTATPVQAGPFLDWLLGRPIYTYPATTVGYAPAPIVAGYAPTPVVAGYAAAPVVAGYAPAPIAPTTVTTAPVTPPVVASYPPASLPYTLPAVTATPTSVTPAPVTAYYPGTAPAPVSGYTAAAPAYVANYPGALGIGYVPSYRTTWFRVPVTNYRPVTAYQGVTAYQPATTLPVTPMQPCNSYTWQAQRVPTWFGYRPWLPAPAPAAVYVPPAAVAPMYGVPAPTTMGAATTAPTLVAPPTLAAPPAGSYPAPGGLPGFGVPAPQLPAEGGSVPADQAPTLSPDGMPMGVPNSAMRSVPSPVTTTSRPAQAPASSVYQVKPIPVPEWKDSPAPSTPPAAPPLLNARDRTASSVVPPAGLATRVAPAVWSQPGRPQSPPAPRRPLWDDSGWQAAGSR